MEEPHYNNHLWDSYTLYLSITDTDSQALALVSHTHVCEAPMYSLIQTIKGRHYWQMYSMQTLTTQDYMHPVPDSGIPSFDKGLLLQISKAVFFFWISLKSNEHLP